MNENKRQKIYRTIMLIVVVSIITFVVTSIMNYDDSIKHLVSSKSNASISQKLDSALATITEILEEKYIGDVNQEALIEGALKGMVESVGDVYTEYYTKQELDDFTATTIGNFVGIGIYMQADLENDTVVVISAMPGSPAEEAGLQTGDKIIKVDGVEYSAEQITELSNHIKGEEGTTVELTILRNEETFNFTITRKTVHVNYVSSEMLEDNIGYIAISTFDEGCSEDFINEYNKLAEQGIKSLIIDLRSNGGGLVDEALNIADLICDKGNVILVTADKDEKKETTKSKNNPKIKIPVVVLTDKGTASASEILAAALQDNKKAEIVGENTFGKGVIQELVYLSNGGALKVTASEYYTPNGNKINEIGIKPDYEVKYDYTDESVDEPLEKAEEVLKEKIK